MVAIAKQNKNASRPPQPLQVAVAEGFLEEVTLKGAWGRGAEKGGRGAGPPGGAGGDMQSAQQERPVTPGRSHPPSPPRGCAPFPRRRRQSLCRPRSPLRGAEPVPPHGAQTGQRHKPHVATLKGGTCGVGSGDSRCETGRGGCPRPVASPPPRAWDRPARRPTWPRVPLGSWLFLPRPEPVAAWHTSQPPGGPRVAGSGLGKPGG